MENFYLEGILVGEEKPKDVPDQRILPERVSSGIPHIKKRKVRRGQEKINLNEYEPTSPNIYVAETSEGDRRIFEYEGRWTELLDEIGSLENRASMYSHLPKELVPRSFQWLMKRTNFLDIDEQVEGERWPQAPRGIINVGRIVLITERDGISMSGEAPKPKELNQIITKIEVEVSEEEPESSIIQLGGYRATGRLNNTGRALNYVTKNGVPVLLFDERTSVGLDYLKARRLKGKWIITSPEIDVVLEETDIETHFSGDQRVISGRIANMLLMYCADQGHLHQ